MEKQVWDKRLYPNRVPCIFHFVEKTYHTIQQEALLKSSGPFSG